jgi:hypothetical protein
VKVVSKVVETSVVSCGFDGSQRCATLQRLHDLNFKIISNCKQPNNNIGFKFEFDNLYIPLQGWWVVRRWF